LKEKMAESVSERVEAGPNDDAEGVARGGLRRVISHLDAAALAVGIVVGTGIFAVPGYVALELGAPGPILAAWALGGVVALAGAMTLAELASMFPRQGGSLVYVLRAFGPFPAFLKGWGSFLVGYPASCAGIATVFGIYLAEALSWDGGAKPLAFAALAAVWFLNLRGTRFSASLQTVLTLAKVGALVALALLALFLGSAHWDRLFTTGASVPGPRAFAAALVGILWTYDGWQNLAVVSGEIRDPGRVIVRALVSAIGIVIGTYLLVNVSYLVLLPFDELAGAESAASSAARSVLGPWGGTLLAVLVGVSSFGALFGISVAGPRYFYSMAENGLFFRVAARVDERTSAPRWGATALFVTSAAYVATSTFEQIMGFYIAVTLLYNVLSVASIFRLRAKLPDAPRPFRVPGYPWVPILFIVGALWVTGNEIARNPWRSGIGVGVLFLAAPVYVWWKRARPA
jgi:amino acid transporter